MKNKRLLTRMGLGIAALLVATLSAVTVLAAETYPIGDLSFDGSVSAADLTALARQVAKMDPLPEGYTAMGVPSWDCEHYESDWFTVKEPHCTEDGFRHILCMICGKELEREVLPATGHTEVVDEGVAPSCTEPGLSEGVHCSVCNEVLTAQEVLPVTGHTAVADAFVSPDCTNSGLTAGSHCGVCGHVIVAQRPIAALGHVPGEWEVTLEPTATTLGSRHKVCTICGEETEVEAIAPLGSQGLTYSYDATTMTATVTDIGTCTDTELVIPSTVDGYTVTGVADTAFGFCGDLTSVAIPNTVTAIGNYAFRNCSGLTSITIPDSVTSIGDSAFYYCTVLASITIPDSVTSIGGKAFTGTAYYNDTSNWKSGVLYIGNHLIKAKTTITSCTIKDGTKTIAGEAFLDCRDLTSITIPDGVTSIGDSAFYYCSSLSPITIPDSVTSIGRNAFDSTSYANYTGNWKNGVLYIGNHLIDVNTTRTTCTIKAGTKTIAGEAFYCCRKLTSITFEGTVEEWNALSKGINWNLDTGEYTVTCLDGKVAKDGTVTMF